MTPSTPTAEVDRLLSKYAPSKFIDLAHPADAGIVADALALADAVRAQQAQLEAAMELRAFLDLAHAKELGTLWQAAIDAFDAALPPTEKP